MISGAYNSTPVLRRPEYMTYSASSRLFNHSYPFKSTPINSSQFNYSYPNSYSLPQPQILQPIQQFPANSNYFNPNPYPVYNLPAQLSSGTGVSSKGLEAVLIAILILVALDLVVIRPLK